ncbi:hypothetical protein A5756_20455 [Mycobacterium sp. 852002-53434_SCH5985345]|uniref:hypothetical protein n=1 Tax=unclassified Mycobacterium TaxID=2642494 RepID=UPI0007FC09FD|nr:MULTISPECIES: hypothetical protein [unclassified Mycobacterium]OBF51353.1 hypothetical protein A5756_20455 [Mycobacterium sp. 852002-53434_SCH5985345]OBF71892.1 hypothetical protein A5750_19340 [Mycobacterium sp. 852002-51613_SCH5001154]
MKIIVIVAAGLAAGAVVAAGCAQAEIAAAPVPSQFYPLAPGGQSDPEADVDELQRQVAELHDNWDNLTPPQRQQRLTQLQRQATTVSNEVQNLPPAQRPGVEMRLLQTTFTLFDLVRKAQGPNQPCYFPACLPGL